ncbi:MAG: AAA family ATPase [Bacilli bacterium]|nr:AAA family ATPase [Bacilli bacterium]
MIKTFTGPMFSGKTTALLQTYFNMWNKTNILCFKPKINTRDDGIKSKNIKENVVAIEIDDLKDIYEHIKKNTRTIFIDEANFLKGDVSVLIDLSINKNIDIYICGLNMTSEQKPFGIMGDILAVSDYIEIKKSYCTICNREASYTYYEGDKNKDIVVGDSGYISLCEDCLRKKKKNEQ